MFANFFSEAPFCLGSAYMDKTCLLSDHFVQISQTGPRSVRSTMQFYRLAQIFKFLFCRQTSILYLTDMGVPIEQKIDRVDALLEQLEGLPIATLYPHLAAKIPDVLRKWSTTLPSLSWSKMMKRTQGPIPRILKELNEAAPVVDRLLRFVEAEFVRSEQLTQHKEKFTVVDCGSGLGILSMFLAEIMKQTQIEEFYLVDKMWPQKNVDSTKSDGLHMTRGHIDDVQWRIPLKTLKIDLKQGRDLADLVHYIFENGTKATRGTGNRIGLTGSTSFSVPKKNRILLLGVHLCGSLSLRFLDLVNRNRATVAFAALKPCCLPGKMHLRQKMLYSVGSFQFTAEDLYFPDGRPKFESDLETQSTMEEDEEDTMKEEDTNSNSMNVSITEESRWAGKDRFKLWCDNLYQCVEVRENEKADLEEVHVAPDYFQSKFIFLERGLSDTEVGNDMNECLAFNEEENAFRNQILTPLYLKENKRFPKSKAPTTLTT